MWSRGKVEELLREGLGEEPQDVDLSDDTDEEGVAVDERNVSETSRLHQLDRVADGLIERQRSRCLRHHLLDRRLQIDAADDIRSDQASEDVALGQHAEKPAVRV